MQHTDFTKLDLSRLPSPCFVVDEVAVEHNLKILKYVSDESGAKVLAALTAFSMWSLAPLLSRYLDGTCAGGLHEAKLGHEYYAGETHVYSAAYSEQDLLELLRFSNHIVFNSCSQWKRFQAIAITASTKRPELKFGLRINPEHSEGAIAIYDPCARGSRLGIPLSQLDDSALEGISGLHFHTLCGHGFEPLQRTLQAVEAKFDYLLPHMEWVNFGGGHHITAPGYQVENLITLIKDFSARYEVQVYLEPGEAIAIGTGILSCEVLDTTWNQMHHAILDTSATCHMPDILETPYQPDISGADKPRVEPYTYRLGCLTSLAGDVIGDYSFAEPLRVGQRMYFEDMSHYTMVKTTTFSGTKLPSIALWNSETDALRIIKQFGYEDFKNRLS